MGNSNHSAVLEKMDRILRLLALSLTDGKKQGDRVRLLDAAGFKPKEMATIIGTTPNAIRVALYGIRRKRGRSQPQTEEGSGNGG